MIPAVRLAGGAWQAGLFFSPRSDHRHGRKFRVASWYAERRVTTIDRNDLGFRFSAFFDCSATERRESMGRWHAW